MKSKEDILKQIKELEAKYSDSRNVVERAKYTSQIKELQSELNKMEVVHEQKVIKHNDAPSVADHKSGRRVINPGDIAVGGENSFVGII